MRSKLQFFILMCLTLLLSSCFPLSIQKLNALHVGANFESRIIDNKAWAIDRNSFLSAKGIEVFPNWDLADFYPTFEKNSLGLMSSLFGIEKADQSQDQASYILQVRVGRVESKHPALATMESENTISLEFTLIGIVNNKKQTIWTEEISSVAKGANGTTINLPKACHERANKAINEIFIEAQRRIVNHIKAKIG